MSNLVSIIVPVYNVEKYIEKCLQSLLEQTYQAIEIILIDDGSTDKSGKICDNCANVDDRIRVIHQKNKGVSTARNVGIQYASGSYIVFVDPDDWVTSSFIQTLYNLLIDNDAELAIIGVLSHYETLSEEIVDFVDIAKPKELKLMTSEQTLDNILDEDMFLGYLWNKMFKRELIIDNKIKFSEDVKIWEDLLFCCQYILQINKSVYRDEKLYVYNIRKNSVTNSIDNNKEKTKLLAAEKMLEICCEKSNMFIKKMKTMYVSTAIRLAFSCMYANGGYDPEIVKEKIREAKPYIKEGGSYKIKLYYFGLMYMPKSSYYFYRLAKNIKIIN